MCCHDKSIHEISRREFLIGAAATAAAGPILLRVANASEVDVVDMTAAEAQRNRFNGTVAVFYNPSTQIDTREWDSIREFNGPYHPIIPDYRCDDVALLRKHLHWIRRAGIDVIVYDIYGFRTWDITDLPKDKTLPLLVKELANQSKESRKLQLVIWLEKWASDPTIEQYRYGLNYVREHLADKPFYYRYKGHPLALTYLNGGNETISAVEKENTRFTMRRVRPFKTDVWSYVEDYPQTLNREWMPANPGFDGFLEDAYMAKYVNKKELDLESIRKLGKIAAARREDGRLFERQLLRAREVNPEIIFISGWNDWQCCLQIEPAVEYGFKYIDTAARLLGRETETLPYRRHDV
jgi:hypothetical protein